MRGSTVRGRIGRLTAVGLCVAGVLFFPPPVVTAQDGDEPRAYLGLRGFGSNPGTHVRDYWGLSVGGNRNRYLGGELSGDLFERRLKVQGFGSVGEYAVTAVVPQIRVRYPLFDGKLTPYAVAGAGFAVGEFNDRKQGTFGHGVDADRTVPVGTLGGGIEYFLADGLAVGVEVKYLFAGDQTLRIDKVEYSHSIASLLTSFGVRLFYPERPTAPPIDPEGGRMRLYLGLRVGGAAVTNSHVSDRLTIEPEPPAIGPLNQYFGGALGLDITHHVGVELVLEGYETNIELAGVGSVSEYAVYTLMPQLRLRYPLYGGRLVPYLVAGVGMATAETNDRKPKGANVELRTREPGLAAAIGAGLEYLVTRSVAVGAEVKYLYTHGLGLGVAGESRHEVNPGPVLVSLGLRVYLWDF
jgi:opacity protein-like surface antigen